MDTVELTVLVNQVNTPRVKEAGAAHGGRLADRTTAHALAEQEEPPNRLAEKVVDLPEPRESRRSGERSLRQ